MFAAFVHEVLGRMVYLGGGRRSLRRGRGFLATGFTSPSSACLFPPFFSTRRKRVPPEENQTSREKYASGGKPKKKRDYPLRLTLFASSPKGGAKQGRALLAPAKQKRDALF